MSGARHRGAGAGAGFLAALLMLSGCGRYAHFTLPVLRGGDPNMTYTWEPQPGPVLGRGEAWDSHDTLNPSVIRHAGPLPNGRGSELCRTPETEPRVLASGNDMAARLH